ncbi:hypothetical protein [Nitratiruptor tergarcus]|uniref:Uncharacterized protein n=1 Tax=Nitratiruptor tergarcus DSM 16512 TaxID=1069081 RepID=A0A1W1WQC0_9BACT|nr:hypothetical protein [Nitratiruptor tergarcus]SMC08409.1 hypothetical protein SAMN05660197_0161 [Nitratiruptor tergarcus DSM 16512]
MDKNLIQDIYCYASHSFTSDKYNAIAINALTQYKEKYFLIFFLTKKAFLENDPAEISWVAWDEYDIEIIMIASKLCSIEWSYDAIRETVAKVLDKYFGGYLNSQEYAKDIAKIIINDFEKYKNNFSFHKEFEKLLSDYHNGKFPDNSDKCIPVRIDVD